MKVLYILDTFETGGAEKSLLEIAVNNKLVTSVFVTIYKGNKLIKEAEEAGIKVYQLNLKEKYAFKKAVNLLKVIVKTEKPNLIHSTLFRSDIIARKLKNSFDIPLVSSLVNNSYSNDRYSKLNFYNKVKLFLIQKIDAFTAKKVDLFISNSQTIKKSNARRLGLDLSKIKVIFRGRSFSKYDSVNFLEKEKIKKELGICDLDFVFLNVSRLLERKGQLDFIEALSKLVHVYPNVKAFIAGEGEYRIKLENTIKEKKLNNHVRLLGNRDDIPNLLAVADCFVFPSYYEGLPGALIEAMLSKKIIICSNIPENKECVTVDSAVIFEKGNISQLSKEMVAIIENKDKYLILGNMAYKEAVSKFDINAVIFQYNTMYRKVTSRN